MGSSGSAAESRMRLQPDSTANEIMATSADNIQLRKMAVMGGDPQVDENVG